jgi:hypothetical protein
MGDAIRLRSLLAFLALTLTAMGAAQAACPANTHPVYTDARKVGDDTVVPCDCNAGYVPLNQSCILPREADHVCSLDQGKVYYNRRCRAAQDAEAMLRNKIRTAAEGARSSLQTIWCEHQAALNEIRRSHVYPAAAALILLITGRPEGMEAEAVYYQLETMGLQLNTARCTTNDNVKAACANFANFVKILGEARADTARIQGRPVPPSIGPAGTTIGPAPNAETPSLWPNPQEEALYDKCVP